MANAAVKSADTALSITRLLDATRERVWRAWSDPAEASRWLGPGGWTGTFKSADMSPGGSYTIEMKHEDGDEMVAEGRFREIVPLEKLVYTWAWRGEDGKPGHETLVTVTFKSVGNKTELTLRHEGFESKESRDGHLGGWNGCFDKLDDVLAGRR
jgi:uncharacterized protein YndB with AHSA1/START domain